MSARKMSTADSRLGGIIVRARSMNFECLGGVKTSGIVQLRLIAEYTQRALRDKKRRDEYKRRVYQARLHNF